MDSCAAAKANGSTNRCDSIRRPAGCLQSQPLCPSSALSLPVAAVRRICRSQRSCCTAVLHVDVSSSHLSGRCGVSRADRLFVFLCFLSVPFFLVTDRPARSLSSAATRRLACVRAAVALLIQPSAGGKRRRPASRRCDHCHWLLRCSQPSVCLLAVAPLHPSSRRCMSVCLEEQ